MPVGPIISAFDDAAQFVLRMFGKGKANNKTNPYPFNPKRPQDLISALDNPATRKSAIARMQDLHYGAYYSDTARGTGARWAEREILRKGKGYGGVFFGRPAKGLSVAKAHLGYSFGKPALLFGGLGLITSMYTAPRGHKMSAGAGTMGDLIGFAIGDTIGTALGTPLLGLAVGYTFGKIGGEVGEALQAFNDYSRIARHVNMGGNYEDTRIAFTMRQRAAQEMGSSVMNARQWLGKEGILMHQ